jgi:hypothetical protein
LPTIVQKGNIQLRVFFSDTMRHKAPHLHVYVGGESVAVVGLVTLRPLVGGPLPRRVRRLIEAHIDELWEAWENCNG